MKKFTLVSLARAKKSATSAFMGLAILFVTLNFVNATLSIKVYSSNFDSSEGIGLQNDESEDEDPTNIDEKTLKKDTNLIDLLDCLYGDHRYKYPNLTESIAKIRFDEALHQKSYEKILNSHVIKSSTNNEQFTGCQNNDTDNDSNNFGCSVCEPFENENIILTYDNKGPESNVPVVVSQIHNERISDDTGKCFDADGNIRSLETMLEFTSPYSFPPIPWAKGESVLYSKHNYFSYPPDTK